jgi:hypothetical protein
MSRIYNFNEFINEGGIQVTDQKKFANLLVDSIDFYSKKSPGEIINTAGFGDSGKSPIMPFIYCIYSKFIKDSGSSYTLPKEISPIKFWEKLPSDVKKTLNDAKSNFSIIKPGQIIIFKSSKGSNAAIVFGTDPSTKSIYIYTNNKGKVLIEKTDLKALIKGFVDILEGDDSDFVSVFSSRYKEDINTAKSKKAIYKMGGGTVSDDGEVESKVDGSDEKSGGFYDLFASAAKELEDFGSREST